MARELAAKLIGCSPQTSTPARGFEWFRKRNMPADHTSVRFFGSEEPLDRTK